VIACTVWARRSACSPGSDSPKCFTLPTAIIGRVEEGDAAIHGLADQRDAFLLADLVRVAEIKSHAAVAEGKNLKSVVTEHALLRVVVTVRCDE